MQYHYSSFFLLHAILLQLALWAVPVPDIGANICCDLLHTEEIFKAPFSELPAKAAALVAAPGSLQAIYNAQQLYPVMMCTTPS